MPTESFDAGGNSSFGQARGMLRQEMPGMEGIFIKLSLKTTNSNDSSLGANAEMVRSISNALFELKRGKGKNPAAECNIITAQRQLR